MEFQKTIPDQFINLYFNSMVWVENLLWLKTPILKFPFDLWVYQEIISEQQPDLIIECGTFKGGSALFLASICDLIGNGKVVTIDINHDDHRPPHPRITYLLGSSTSGEVLTEVNALTGKGESVMVILDSDHHYEHVRKELQIYSRLVTRGSYLIVEDTAVNGNPLLPDFGPGPMEAVKEFLQENQDFIIDKTREKLFLTFNPNGYLKRIN